MVRNRSISSIIGNKPTKRPSQPSARSTRRRDNKVPCHCNKCNGKLVLIRTKLFHESADTTHEDSAVEQPNLDDTGSPVETRIEMTMVETTDDISPNLEMTDDNSMVDDISPNLPSVPRRRPRRYISHPQVTDSEDEQHIESSLNEPEDNESNPPDYDLLISETFEDYSAPKYEPQDEEEEVKIDDQFAWILLWILNFRIRFNIPETATESLIKFMKLVLTEIGSNRFNDFPSTLYLAKKSLGIKDRFHNFIPCTKCHKLYNKDEMVNFRQTKP